MTGMKSTRAEADISLFSEQDARPVRWRDLGLDRSVFWSSPETLPVWMTIISVLKSGRHRFVFSILRHFGANRVKHYLSVLEAGQSINPVIADYDRFLIKVWEEKFGSPDGQ